MGRSETPEGSAIVDPTTTAHVAAPSEPEGWRAEEFAVWVHYRGTDNAHNIEYYEPSDCVLCWKVKGDGEIAVPVDRDMILSPLRECARQDLVEAGVDLEVEDRVV